MLLGPYIVTARASDSMFYPLTMCALQIVFMIMIIIMIINAGICNTNTARFHRSLMHNTSHQQQILRRSIHARKIYAVGCSGNMQYAHHCLIYRNVICDMKI